MKKLTVQIVLGILIAGLLTVACGNKGPLVKPEQKPTEAEAQK